jgi:hypothetical protein
LLAAVEGVGVTGTDVEDAVVRLRVPKRDGHHGLDTGLAGVRKPSRVGVGHRRRVEYL